MVPRAVVDTCVIISGLIGRGTSNRLLISILRGEVRLIMSADIFDEYLRAIHYPRLRLPLALAYIILDELYRRAEIVVPKTEISMCRDPEDDKFLEAAYEAKADYIITFDRDLLALRDDAKELALREHHIRLLTPREFLEEHAL